VEGFDDAHAGRRQAGAAAGPPAGAGREQGLPEQVRHRVERVPGGLVGEADRPGAGGDAAFARDRLQEADPVAPHRRDSLVPQGDQGFDRHESRSSSVV
jgi:hypothetical protein